MKYKNYRHKVPKKYKVLKGTIIKRKPDQFMYKVKIQLENGHITKWLPMSDIKATSFQKQKESLGARKDNILNMDDFVYNMKEKLQDLSTTFGLPVAHNPVGDGSCQFGAVSYHLTRLGIFRSPDTLRDEVVQFLSRTPCLITQ